MNLKWLMVCTGIIFAASAGLVACGDTGDDEPCTENADCSQAGDVCINGECEQLCDEDADCRGDDVCVEVRVGDQLARICEPAELQCTTNAQCPTGQACVDGFCQNEAVEACTDDDDCTGTDVCVGGQCIAPVTNNECTENAECFADNGYCAEVGNETQCVSVACGEPLNNCGRCDLGPNSGNRSSNGPVIFFPSQVDIGSGAQNCTQDQTQCLPGSAPWVCEFSFLADGPGTLPTSDLNNRIRVISRNGQELTVFGGRTTTTGGIRQYNFRACFPETTGGTIGTATVLRVDSNTHSNSLCVDGRL